MSIQCALDSCRKRIVNPEDAMWSYDGKNAYCCINHFSEDGEKKLQERRELWMKELRHRLHCAIDAESRALCA